MRSPILLELTPYDSTNTTTLCNKTCPLNTSCDHLPHLDHLSISSELKDNSTVGSTEPESFLDSEDPFQLDSFSVSSKATCSIETDFLPEFEGQLDHTNLSTTDVFSGHHDYEPFLLQQEIDGPHDNISHLDTHVYEEQDHDVILTHATILSHTFVTKTIMNTMGPLTWQTQYQQISKSPVITLCILSVLLTQWKSSATSTLTLITTQHCPNFWHTTIVKTWIPLTCQVHYQPLSKLPMMTHTTLSVVIAQWKLSANYLSTPP